MLVLAGDAQLQFRRHRFTGAERMNEGVFAFQVDRRLRYFAFQHIEQRIESGRCNEGPRNRYKTEPAEVTLPRGTEQTFVVSILNQFGTVIDTCVSAYRATQVGDFEQSFDCFDMTDTALIHVKTFEEVNLALHKPATASGAEGDNMNASKAVDGDLTTRWSSRFLDNEWIAVDLGTCYLLNLVKLYWENAYATSFDIELSQDGEQYTCVKSVKGAQGGVQSIDIRTDGKAIEAQFVRIVCKTRNTGYGSSLWELEVYGEATCDKQEQAVETVFCPQSSNRKYLKDGQLFISHDGIVYTVSGLVFMR